eukprot:365826-Chlamydomonas_euryale.AAC.16
MQSRMKLMGAGAWPSLSACGNSHLQPCHTSHPGNTWPRYRAVPGHGPVADAAAPAPSSRPHRRDCPDEHLAPRIEPRLPRTSVGSHLRPVAIGSSQPDDAARATAQMGPRQLPAALWPGSGCKRRECAADAAGNNRIATADAAAAASGRDWGVGDADAPANRRLGRRDASRAATAADGRVSGCRDAVHGGCAGEREGAEEDATCSCAGSMCCRRGCMRT